MGAQVADCEREIVGISAKTCSGLVSLQVFIRTNHSYRVALDHGFAGRVHGLPHHRQRKGTGRPNSDVRRHHLVANAGNLFWQGFAQCVTHAHLRHPKRPSTSSRTKRRIMETPHSNLSSRTFAMFSGLVKKARYISSIRLRLAIRFDPFVDTGEAKATA